MPDSIFMHELLTGVCTEGDDGGVSLAEPRVKFVKGWLTGGTDPGDGSVECGDGTMYPVQVTLDQLAEIYYRVRDAEITGNLQFIESEDANVQTIQFTPYVPEQINMWSGEAAYTYRAYSSGGTNLESEREIWTEELDKPYPFLPDLITGFSCSSFSYQSGDETPNSGYYVNSFEDGLYYGAGFDLQFYNTIAVIYAPGSTSIFDSGTTIWIGMRLVATGESLLYADTESYPDSVKISGTTLVLSNSTLPIPLYMDSFWYYVSSDLTIKATEWWPYATPGPTWNHLTGEPN